MSKRFPIDFTEYPFDRMNVAELRRLRPVRGDFEMRQASPPELEKMEPFASGIFDATFDAEIILQLETEDLATPHAYFYLVRRFGFPQNDCDDYKQMGVYYLTTPHPDVVLRVLILASLVMFSVLTTRETARACWRRDAAPLERRARKFRRWARKNHGITLAGSFDLFDEDYLPTVNREYARWIARNYPGTNLNALAEVSRKRFLAAAQKRFLKIKETEYQKLFKKFVREFPALRDVRPNAYADFKNGVIGQVRRAACRAVLELRRPVYVRDVYFNVKKYLSDGEAAKLKTAAYSAYAGYGVPIETYTNLDAETAAGGENEASKNRAAKNAPRRVRRRSRPKRPKQSKRPKRWSAASIY